MPTASPDGDTPQLTSPVISAAGSKNACEASFTKTVPLTTTSSKKACEALTIVTSPPKRAGSPSVLPPDKIVKITDGDTLYVLDANYKEHKIRLAGIDAPERKQAYGLASRKHLASIVAGKQDQNTDVFIPNTDDVRHLMSELRGTSRCTAKRPNERFVMKHQLELISFCV